MKISRAEKRHIKSKIKQIKSLNPNTMVKLNIAGMPSVEVPAHQAINGLEMYLSVLG